MTLLQKLEHLLLWPDVRFIDGEWWLVRCPKCVKWFRDLRHGYSTDFMTGVYFRCPDCLTKIEAPDDIGGWAR